MTLAAAASTTTNVATSGTSDTALRQLWRLYTTELRLVFRESQVLVFVFAFPVITVLVLGGVFGTDTDDSGFEYINPSHFYIAAYFGVVLCAIGTIMLPVHVASYRENGVLRRFDVSGFPKWAFPASQFLTGITFALLGFATLLLTAVLTSGIPSMESPGRVLIGLACGTLAFISFGVALGSLLPNARAAQGTGMLLFFPMFLLAGGGPPPEAMGSTMKAIANWLPLTHVIRAVLEPWFGLADGSNHLVIVIGVFIVSTAVWVWKSRSVSNAA